MLVNDATWSMPPLPTWYRGRQAIEEWITGEVFGEKWRHLVTRASGQLAVGCYTFDNDRRCYIASVLDVLTLDGGRIASVTGFITVRTGPAAGQRDDRSWGTDAFPRFGLPGELDA